MHWAGASYWGTRNRCLPNTSAPWEVIGEEVRGGVPKSLPAQVILTQNDFFWGGYTSLLS